MSATTYQIHLDEQEKAETFAVFKSLGIEPAEAVQLFFSQVRKTHTLPFLVEHIPNARTAKILASEDYSAAFETVGALFADLKQ